MVYFDAHSSVGHPTVNKWIPLEYKGGLKTDTIHECSKRPKSVLLHSNNTAAASIKMDNLAVIKQISQAMNEYIAMKEGVLKK